MQMHSRIFIVLVLCLTFSAIQSVPQNILQNLISHIRNTNVSKIKSIIHNHENSFTPNNIYEIRSTYDQLNKKLVKCEKRIKKYSSETYFWLETTPFLAFFAALIHSFSEIPIPRQNGYRQTFSHKLKNYIFRGINLTLKSTKYTFLGLAGLATAYTIHQAGAYTYYKYRQNRFGATFDTLVEKFQYPNIV